VAWGAWTLTAEKKTGALPRKIGQEDAYLAAGAVRGKLRVRSRKAGDRLRPLGLRGTKKLQDILVDAGIPAEERDEVPVLCDDEGILWVAGQRLAERAAVRERDEMVHVRARRKGRRARR
jgi:tRNA(Ile)-lysidine synthase